MTPATALSAESPNIRTADRARAFALPGAMMTLLALGIGFQPLPRDPDLWFHIAGGEHILAHGTVPDTDPFSLTRAGELWVPHSWMFDIGVALGHRQLGPRMTEAGFALLFATAIVLAYRMMIRRGVLPVTALTVGLGLAIAAANTRGPRPQVLSLLLCMVLVTLLARHRRRATWHVAWALPLMFVCWAQLHAACVMGLVVGVIWTAGRILDAWGAKDRSAVGCELTVLAVALPLSGLAILITPHAITHYEYVALTAGLDALRHTEEWQPPHLLPLAVPDIYVFALLGGVVIALARRRRRIAWCEVSLCVGLLVLALTAVRHLPLACVGAVPLLASALRRKSAPSAGAIAKLPIGTAPAGLLLVIALWNYPTSVARRYAAVEPVAGARALALYSGTWRVFTTYNTGSYVLAEAPGRLRVFLDSRADVYGDDLAADARHAQRGHGWEELFERWRINAAVIESGDSLAQILDEHPRWRVLARDRATVTYVRVDAPPLAC